MATSASVQGDAIDPGRRTARSRRLLLGALALVPLAAAPAHAGAPAPVPAAALQHETIAIADQPVRADVGPGGVWAVATDLSFVQRIDPRSNDPMGSPIVTPGAVAITINRRGIFVTRAADTSGTTFERIRLTRESGAQIGEPQPVPPLLEKDAAGKFHQRLSRGWDIETTGDVHDAPVAVRRDFYGAVLQRVVLGVNYVTSTGVDHRATLWVGGYPSARRVVAGAEAAQAVVPGARQGAIAVGQNAAWLVGQSAARSGNRVTLTKRLFRVDLVTGRQVGAPLTLGSVVQGFPYSRDIAVNRIVLGKGSAWISGPTPGTLTRVILSRR
jgi:hypothetical protein